MNVPHHLRLLVGALLVVLTAAGCSRSAQSHFDRGNAYLDKSNETAAVLEFRSAVGKDPKFAAAHVKLAEIYLKRGDGARALHHRVRAADLLPNDVDAQLKAGSLLLAADKFQDAQARADKALAIDLRSADALVLRANALALLNNVDDAIKQVQQAIALDPTATRASSSLQKGGARRPRPRSARRSRRIPSRSWPSSRWRSSCGRPAGCPRPRPR